MIIVLLSKKQYFTNSMTCIEIPVFPIVSETKQALLPLKTKTFQHYTYVSSSFQFLVNKLTQGFRTHRKAINLLN